MLKVDHRIVGHTQWKQQGKEAWGQSFSMELDRVSDTNHTSQNVYIYIYIFQWLTRETSVTSLSLMVSTFHLAHVISSVIYPWAVIRIKLHTLQQHYQQ